MIHEFPCFGLFWSVWFVSFVRVASHFCVCWLVVWFLAIGYWLLVIGCMHISHFQRRFQKWIQGVWIGCTGISGYRNKSCYFSRKFFYYVYFYTRDLCTIQSSYL